MTEMVPQYNISVTCGETTWSKRIDAEQFSKFQNASHNGRNYKSIFFGLFLPIRTHSITVVVEDLLLPTFIHYAMTIKESEGIKKAFGLIGAFFIDLAFLKIRFLLIGIRWLVNEGQNNRSQQKMWQELIKAGAPQNITNADVVKINLTSWSSTLSNDNQPTPTANVSTGSEQIHDFKQIETDYLFIDLPDNQRETASSSFTLVTG